MGYLLKNQKFKKGILKNVKQKILIFLRKILKDINFETNMDSW